MSYTPNTLDDHERQPCYRPLVDVVRTGKASLLIHGGGSPVNTDEVKAADVPFVAILQARDRSTAAFYGVTELLDLADHVLLTETDALLGYADADRRAEAGKSTVIVETWPEATRGWAEYLTVFPTLPIDWQPTPQPDGGEEVQ